MLLFSENILLIFTKRKVIQSRTSFTKEFTNYKKPWGFFLVKSTYTFFCNVFTKSVSISATFLTSVLRFGVSFPGYSVRKKLNKIPLIHIFCHICYLASGVQLPIANIRNVYCISMLMNVSG